MKLKSRLILGGAVGILLTMLMGSLLHIGLMAQGLRAPWDFLATLGPFLLLLLLPLWLALDRWVFRPLQRLNEANASVARGNLEGGLLPEAITPDEMGDVIRSRNEMLAALLHQRRNLDEDREHAEALTRSLLLFASGEVGAGLQVILEHACRHLGLDGGFVLLLDPQGERHRLVASHRLPDAIVGREESFFAGSCDCIEAAKRSTDGHKPAVRPCSCLLAAGVDRRVLRVPLVVDSLVLGVMIFLGPTDEGLPESSRALLDDTGLAIAVGLSRALLAEELRELNLALEDRVARRTFELQVMLELAQEVGYTLSYEALMRSMLEHLHEVVPHDVGVGLIAMGDFPECFIRYMRPVAPTVQSEVEERLVKTFARVGGRAANLEGCGFRVLDSDYDAGLPPMTRLGSAFQVPLVMERRVVGLLFIGAEREDAFSEEHVRCLYLVASQASVSIQRLRSLLDVEHRRLEGLIDSLPDGVLLLDRDDRMVLANPAARRHLSLLTEAGTGDVVTHLGGTPLATLARPPADGLPCEIVVEGSPRRTFELVRSAVESGPEAGGRVLTLRELTRERELLDELRASDATRRELLSRLVKAQEEERERVAGDLHDDSVQIMTAVLLRLGALRRTVSDAALVSRLDDLQRDVQEAIKRLRVMIFDLRPPVLDRDGLVPALRQCLENAFEGTEVEWKVDAHLNSEPPTEARAVLYRIAQEAVRNVRHHAQAAYVTVRVAEHEGGVRVQVVDDGVGFSPDGGETPGHMGLISMRQRAEIAGGWCRVDSRPGAGTTVEFWIRDASYPSSSADVGAAVSGA